MNSSDSSFNISACIRNEQSLQPNGFSSHAVFNDA
jgi:hypothetical protein